MLQMKSKSLIKSKGFWIGILQVAGGIASGVLTSNWGFGISQILLGGTAILERIFSKRAPVHVGRGEIPG